MGRGQEDQQGPCPQRLSSGGGFWERAGVEAQKLETDSSELCVPASPQKVLAASAKAAGEDSAGCWGQDSHPSS